MVAAMFNVLITGKLAKAPKTGTGASGGKWTSASVRCPVQGAKEGEPDSVFASVIAFGSDANKLAALGVGDAVSVTGNARLTQWEKDGVVHAGLSVTASGILTAYQVKQKRDKAKGEQEAPAEEQRQQRTDNRAPARHDDGFDDDIPF
jgi:single-strand DNA-binding protein